MPGEVEVPEEAVEAVAKRRVGAWFGMTYGGEAGWKKFQTARPMDFLRYMDEARCDLAAAVPSIRSQERQRVRELLETAQRFVPGMADEGHPDGSEYPTIRPHDEGDLLRHDDVLAALDSLGDGDGKCERCDGSGEEVITEPDSETPGRQTRHTCLDFKGAGR